MSEFQDIRLAFGESDEYSFVFSKACELYGRGGRVGSIRAGTQTCSSAASMAVAPQAALQE